MRLTLKQSIGATMLALSLAGVILLMISAELYKQLAYENEQAALSEMTGLKMNDLTNKLDRLSKEMVSFLQQEKKMRILFKNKDSAAITQNLNDQFFQYYTTAGILKIARIYAYDIKFNLLAESTEGYLKPPKGTQLCPRIIEKAKPRKGAERLKSLSEACIHEGLGYHSVLVSVGGLIPKGYLEIVTDISYSMIPAEKDMGNPISIKQPNGVIAYQSKHWPSPKLMDNYLYAEHDYINEGGEKILTLGITRDIEAFRQSFQETLNIVIALSLLIITPAIITAIYLIRHAFKPLDDLRLASEELSSGKYVTIKESSFPEINTVVNSFNTMSNDISGLIEKLEVENLQRKKVQEALKENQYNLEIARDHALQATETKSNFLANMSHEIRTPLTAIIGFSKILQKKQVDEERKRKSIRTIIKNSEHLLHIINDILDISKIEADKLEIANTKIRLFQFMHDLNNIVAESILEKNLDFQIKYQYPLPTTFFSDEVRLKQVLINLVGNAKKFTANGHVYIHIYYSEPENTLHFEVEDSGIGLDPEQADKIFTAFTQADSSTTKKYGGTGLGLSISQQLTQKLGGELSVNSESNKGSTFKFYINPGNKQDLEFCSTRQEVNSEDIPLDNIIDSTAVEGNILLVEDTIDNQELIGSYLNDMGAEVVFANNGQEALDICEKQQFDLILMDMQMPVMGGLEAIKNLRSRNYEGPIAMLTANAFEDEKQRSLKAGCDDFLVKPINIRALCKTVNRYLLSALEAKVIHQEDTDKKEQIDEYIVSSIMGRSEKYDKMVAKFIDHLPEFLSDLSQAYETQNQMDIKKETHRLKGVGGTYGFRMITDTCLAIEENLSNNQLDQIKQHIGELEDITQKINIGLKKYQAANSGN